MGNGLVLEKLSHWKNLLARNEVAIFTGADEGAQAPGTDEEA